MNYEQAMNIMEQAVMLAVKGAQTLNDVKLIVTAWETIKAKLNEVKNDNGNTDNHDI